jgi:hypothetical protein
MCLWLGECVFIEDTQCGCAAYWGLPRDFLGGDSPNTPASSAPRIVGVSSCKVIYIFFL